MESTFCQLISRRLAAALESLGIPGAEPQVVRASDPRFGDYQSNAAMVLAKTRKTNPRALAQEIAGALDLAGLCDPPEIAGPGFLNFRVAQGALACALAGLATDPNLGVRPPASPRRYVVDFSSPNVAKPMHVGHIRSTILGDAIARIAAFCGHSVVRDNHIGDWGTQFGMLLLGWKNGLDEAALAADPIGEMERLYKSVYAACAADPATREAARAELVRLQAGDETNLAIWRRMIELSQNQFDTLYARLDIRFDVTLGESFYNPWLPGVVADLLQKGIARESDGAVCVFSDGSLPEKDDPFKIGRDGTFEDLPALVRKADGAANYTTTDLATLDYRVREFAPDEIVYVTDGRQQLHFRQLFAIFRRWRPAVQTVLSHVWFGSILSEDGKPFKTRSGETVKLADLLDEAESRAFDLVTGKSPDLPEAERKSIAAIVGIGAVKYADLLPNRQSDYVFSWDRMLSLQGNTAPYLQYSCVRIASIFRKGGIAPDALDLSALAFTEPAERDLALKTAQFAEVVPQVLDGFRPNILALYLYELASAFHGFFEACPVLKAEGTARTTRLALCATVLRALETGLGLLGIRVPPRM